MRKSSKTEAAKYYTSLRAKWKAAKDVVDAGLSDDDIKGLETVRAAIPSMSSTNYLFVAIDMRAQGLPGLPGLDAKTFDLWKASGFKVKKGETSKLSCLVWISGKKKDGDDDDDSFLYPKATKLFHTSQVEPI